MSLEVLNTIGTLTTTVIVAATAIAALIQLRHLRASNQINAMLSIVDKLDEKRVQDALVLVREDLSAAIDDPVYRELLVTRTRNQKPPDVSPAYLDLANATRLVGNSFEELGILVKRGMVDNKIFLDRYGYVILRTWGLVEPTIGLVREASGVPSIWENFEYIAVLSEDWMKQYPSSYPRGVRRMQVTNRWPVAAAPAR